MHFPGGAINKETQLYELPIEASKQNNYECPCCSRDIIFKKGRIKIPHFSHKSSINPCNYYISPSESQIHKDAKIVMKKILDDKKMLTFSRKCSDCWFEEDILVLDNYNTSQAFLEYRFYFNNSQRSADVALISDNEIQYIFEIYHTHKTLDINRPEPWFEIKAQTFLDNCYETIEDSKERGILVSCDREHLCDYCRIKQNRQRDIRRYEKERIEKKITQQICFKKLLLNKKEANMKRIMEIETEKEAEREKEIDEGKTMRNEDTRTFEIIKKEKLTQMRRCERHCNCIEKSFDLYKFCKTCKKKKCNCSKIVNFFHLT